MLLQARAPMRRDKLLLALATVATLVMHALLLIGVHASASRPWGNALHRGERVIYVDAVSSTVAAVADAPPVVEREVQVRPVVRQANEERLPRPLAAPASSVRGVPAGEDYMDAGRLSVRASPVGEVAIPEPEVNGRRGVLKATLILFIDSDGEVNGIDVEESALPPEFEASAKQAFAQARFHPGIFRGRFVKSKLRIEVVFDSGVPEQ